MTKVEYKSDFKTTEDDTPHLMSYGTSFVRI